MILLVNVGVCLTFKSLFIGGSSLLKDVHHGIPSSGGSYCREPYMCTMLFYLLPDHNFAIILHSWC